MKFTFISLLYGLLATLSPSSSVSLSHRPHTVPCPVEKAPEICVEETLAVASSVQEEEAATSRSSELTQPVAPEGPPVILNDPPRRWILSDKTWQSMAESRFNVDWSLDRGHEYIGVRIVLPFGS